MKLASIFTDGLVLQKGLEIRVFGEGRGKVKVSFLGNSAEGEFYSDDWCLTLPPCEYGGPYEMSIILNGEETVIHDIYVGEVWVASGQSNMEMPLFRTEHGFAEAEKCYNEKIRFFNVPRRVERDIPKYGWHFITEDGNDTPWQICEEKTALKFSAIGYYVAKELNKALGVAVGIIGCNWGARKLETFISRDYAHKSPFLKKVADEYYEMVKKSSGYTANNYS